MKPIAKFYMLRRTDGRAAESATYGDYDSASGAAQKLSELLKQPIVVLVAHSVVETKCQHSWEVL